MARGGRVRGVLVGEFVRAGDRNVYTRRSRAASAPAARPPVVLVHGLSVSGEYMVPLAEAMEPRFSPHVPDLPGFGRSDKPDHTLDIIELADALAEWAEAADVGRPALIANSLGSQVVAEFAARYPARAGPLVFVGPTMDPALGLKDLVLNLLKDAALEEPSLLPVHLADDVRAGVARTWQTFEAAREHDMEGALRRVRSPVLVVRGEHDPLVSEAWARRVARLARGEYAELAGAPHAANYSTPGALARVVGEFLARASPVAWNP